MTQCFIFKHWLWLWLWLPHGYQTGGDINKQRETSQEGIIQVRDNVGLDQTSTQRESEKLNSGCILKVESRSFTNRIIVGVKHKETSRIKPRCLTSGGENERGADLENGWQIMNSVWVMNQTLSQTLDMVVAMLQDGCQQSLTCKDHTHVSFAPTLDQGFSV